MNVEIESDLNLSHSKLRMNPSITISGLLFLLRGYIQDPITEADALYLFDSRGALLPMTKRLRDIGASPLKFKLMKESSFGEGFYAGVRLKFFNRRKKIICLRWQNKFCQQIYKHVVENISTRRH